MHGQQNIETHKIICASGGIRTYNPSRRVAADHALN